MEDKKLAKLKFLEEGFWKRFTQTGNIRDYGRYRGAKDLVKERQQELASGSKQREL